MSYESVPTDRFVDAFGTQTEISSVALGGEIVAVSDEFFAEADNLIKVEPAPSLKGQFGPKGALYSGWETRRHNREHDWCIIKFGAAGVVSGFDIDTAHFNGNEAPEASVQALLDVGDKAPKENDLRWEEILPKVALGPNSRHLFKVPNTKPFNYVKLNMYPDGGIARFRTYGLIRAVFPEDANENVDLAHVFAGGRVVFVSDQHFGVGSNLILPGRGVNMGDGWETKRSRVKGHKDWVIIKLGEPGYLEQTELDTAHFMGNYPESCEVHALYSEDIIPTASEEEWTNVLPRTKLGPHRQHYFQLENVQGRVFSHVRVTIYPDGGLKRVRVIGKRATPDAKVLTTTSEVAENAETVEVPAANAFEADQDAVDKIHVVNESQRVHISGVYGTVTPITSVHTPVPSSPIELVGATIPALPLTPEAFAPFGHVVQAFGDVNAVPRGTKVTSANQGSATKFHKLAPILSSYPPELASRANPALSVYRCKPLDFDVTKDVVQRGAGWAVKLLERHPYTNQAFVPMSAGSGEGLKGDDALEKPGRAYLVVVAKNGGDDRPDLSTLRAFVAGAGQAVVYATGIWHHPMVALETTIDFTCVETQIGDGSEADCEIVELDASKGLPRVKIPIF